MMWKQLVGLVLFGAGAVFAADPVVEYVRISQRAGTKLVDIEYKLTDADGDDMTIAVSGRYSEQPGDACQYLRRHKDDAPEFTPFPELRTAFSPPKRAASLSALRTRFIASTCIVVRE